MNEGARNLRVGLFVAAALATLVAVVFMVGKDRALFRPRTTLYVDFDNIGGLVPGAPVRLAGLDIGYVSSIRLASDLKDRELRVGLSVERQYLPRLRKDSAALIESKGLLGDKIITLTIGSPDKEQLQDGDVIEKTMTGDIERYLGEFLDTVRNIRTVVQDVGRVLSDVSTEDVRADVKSILSSTANILSEVEKGEGSVHSLVYDSKHADDLDALLRELRQTAREFRGVADRLDSPVKRVDKLVTEIEQGQGTLHSLIYADSGTKAVDELRAAAAETKTLVSDIRTGKGLLHSMIYEKADMDFLTAITRFGNKLNELVDRVDRGEGTIGGLLQDPTVYEDLKTTLGDVKRSWTFRTLVRHAIKNDDLKRPPGLKSGEPVPFYDRPTSGAAQNREP